MRCDLDPSRLAVWWSTQHVGLTALPMLDSNSNTALPVPEVKRFRRPDSSQCRAH